MFQKIRVLGYRHFNDTVEGTPHNFTKLRLEMPVPRNSKTEVGHNCVEVVWGESSNADKIKHLKFPIELELDVEMTSRGIDCYEVRIPNAQQVKVA